MFISQTLSTEDFATQAFQTCTQRQSMDIQSYLALMLSQYHEGSEQCIFLPSLLSMAEYFECSAVEIHQALEQLKTFGCDFFIMGFESPITLWYPERLNASASQSA